MGDPSLKIDKYDGRGYLDNLQIYEPGHAATDG
jgi:hypothetical protein